VIKNAPRYLLDTYFCFCCRFSFKGHLGDQDFFTLLSFEHPELFYTLDCGWNRQLCTWWKTKGYEDIFDQYYQCNSKVKIWHGNCDTPIPAWHIAIASVMSNRILHWQAHFQAKCFYLTFVVVLMVCAVILTYSYNLCCAWKPHDHFCLNCDTIT